MTSEHDIGLFGDNYDPPIFYQNFCDPTFFMASSQKTN